MHDWWKSPVLQGPENDYGDYDYLIEELPQDYAKWDFDKEYKWKCGSCGKDSHLLFRSAHYFYTLDGWDSLDYAECWRCRIKDNIRCAIYGIKKKIKRKFSTFKMAIEFYHMKKLKWNFKKCYELAKKLERG